MSARPDAKATSETETIKTSTTIHKARRAIVVAAIGRRGLLVASVLMGSMIAAACGVTWAPHVASPAEAAVAGPSIAGRWSGQVYGIKGDADRCEAGDCRLTIDLVACGKGWCGIEVRDGKTCGAVALRLETDATNEGSVHLKGSLALARGTEKFSVMLSVYQPGDGRPAHARLIGNTGPELMLFRRSFPLEAGLDRVAEPQCRLDEDPPLT